MKYGQAKKIGEACFWLGLMIELLIVIVDKSAYINPLESQLFRLTFLLFCIKIALTKYSTKEWIYILLLVVCCLCLIESMKKMRQYEWLPLSLPAKG